MGAWRGFRMILHTEYRLAAVSEAFYSLVIQIDMRQFYFRIPQGVRIYGEPMVLGCDLYLSSQPIEHGMVRAMMSEL